jgi:hypothetical protein
VLGGIARRERRRASKGARSVRAVRRLGGRMTHPV